MWACLLQEATSWQAGQAVESPAYQEELYTVKKVSDFPIFFPARESLVSDIKAGEEKIANFFVQCTDLIIYKYCRSPLSTALAGTVAGSIQTEK
jgi:hypothetical protein